MPNPLLELELLLRQDTKKFRVVQHLSGGAHLLFPGSETTIAVRAYYPNSLKHPDQDLEAFRNAFKYPIVFFVLPPQAMNEQLSNVDSFLHSTQNAMNGDKQGNAKTFCVPDTKSVVDTILVLLDALHPERRKLREKYYEQTRSIANDKEAVSTRVVRELRALSERLGLAAGEIEILMNHFGSLAKICTANYQALRELPIEEDSKSKLHAFFRSQELPSQGNRDQEATKGDDFQAAFGVNHDALFGDSQFDDMPNYSEFQQAALPYEPQDTLHYGMRHDQAPFSGREQQLAHGNQNPPPFSSRGRQPAPPFRNHEQMQPLQRSPFRSQNQPPPFMNNMTHRPPHHRRPESQWDRPYSQQYGNSVPLYHEVSLTTRKPQGHWAASRVMGQYM